MNTPNPTLSTHLSRFLATSLCLALGACANPGKISPQDRAAIHTVQTVNPPKGAQPNLYSDMTSEAAARAGGQLGLAGALVGGLIAVADVNAGQKRWAPVTAGHDARVLQLVRERVEKRFAEEGKLKFSAAGPGDAQLVITSISYGVGHSGKQTFSVVVQAMFQLKKPGGKMAWQMAGTGTSATSLTLEEYQKNPQAYTKGLEEAAQMLATQVVGGY